MKETYIKISMNKILNITKAINLLKTNQKKKKLYALFYVDRMLERN